MKDKLEIEIGNVNKAGRFKCEECGKTIKLGKGKCLHVTVDSAGGMKKLCRECDK